MWNSEKKLLKGNRKSQKKWVEIEMTKWFTTCRDAFSWKHSFFSHFISSFTPRTVVWPTPLEHRHLTQHSKLNFHLPGQHTYLSSTPIAVCATLTISHVLENEEVVKRSDDDVFFKGKAHNSNKASRQVVNFFFLKTFPHNICADVKNILQTLHVGANLQTRRKK